MVITKTDLKKTLTSFFEGKRILILGFGREGRSSHRLLTELGVGKDLTIADRSPSCELPEGVNSRVGEHYLDNLEEYDLILKSPGISLSASVRDKLKSKLSSQIDLFLRFAPGTKVGITGTKGKSTTTALIYHLLASAGREAKLMGNIGKPVFDTLAELHENSIAVIELSSHQLQTLHAAPDIAAFVSFFPDHLDYYSSMQEYFEAKLRIASMQRADQFFFYNPAIKELEAALPELPGKMVEVRVTEAVNQNLIHPVSVAFSSAITAHLGLTGPEITLYMKSFRGLEHRLERIETSAGSVYFNDSAASLPEATLRALDTLEKVEYLICGGMNRGNEYSQLAERLAKEDDLRCVFIPDTGSELLERVNALNERAASRICFLPSLEEALRYVKSCIKEGEVCLFSPGAPSYHLYSGFEERGKHFKELLLSL